MVDIEFAIPLVLTTCGQSGIKMCFVNQRSIATSHWKYIWQELEQVDQMEKASLIQRLAISMCMY